MMTRATAALDAAGIPFRVHTYRHDPHETNYGVEAATALNLDPERVFKTLIASIDDHLVVAVVPVTGSLDLKALAHALGGKKGALADPALAQRKTGYVLGGISPVGQKTRLPAVIDETAILFDTIFVSGGRRGFDIELSPDDLAVAIAASFAPIARERVG